MLNPDRQHVNATIQHPASRNFVVVTFQQRCPAAIIMMSAGGGTLADFSARPLSRQYSTSPLS
jgi:hypothetical protein